MCSILAGDPKIMEICWHSFNGLMSSMFMTDRQCLTLHILQFWALNVLNSSWNMFTLWISVCWSGISPLWPSPESFGHDKRGIWKFTRVETSERKESQRVVLRRSFRSEGDLCDGWTFVVLNHRGGGGGGEDALAVRCSTLKQEHCECMWTVMVFVWGLSSVPEVLDGLVCRVTAEVLGYCLWVQMYIVFGCECVVFV